MPLVGITGLALLVLAIYLAAMTATQLFVWLIILFAGITLLALSTATRGPRQPP